MVHAKHWFTLNNCYICFKQVLCPFRMPSLRYYYSDSISGFLNREPDDIVGKMTNANPHLLNNDTIASWNDEIKVMKAVLAEYRERGSLFF